MNSNVNWGLQLQATDPYWLTSVATTLHQGKTSTRGVSKQAKGRHSVFPVQFFCKPNPALKVIIVIITIKA